MTPKPPKPQRYKLGMELLMSPDDLRWLAMKVNSTVVPLTPESLAPRLVQAEVRNAIERSKKQQLTG